MVAELVPIRLTVSEEDLYTMWAPRWREDGDEWEAFLGKDEDLFAFKSVADLVAFVRNESDHDLGDHPAWAALVKANAHKLQPADDRHIDLIGVTEILAEKPSEESVRTLAGVMALISSLGTACELPTVNRFFNGNPNLGWLSGGMDQFSGRAGRKRWHTVGEIVGRSWDDVITAVADAITTPDVDANAVREAAKELDEPFEDEAEPIAVETEDDIESLEDAGEDDQDEADEDEADVSPQADNAIHGADPEFWEHVGIDPIRIIMTSGTFYTLRCYYPEDEPRFLGRNGRVSVFPSERTLTRYLADEHDHDLADLVTYDDIRTAATDGSLRAFVTEENVYVLTGLVDDIAGGPDAIDREQLHLAVELIRDIGVYSEEDTVDTLLADDHALGKLVNHVLDPDFVKKPGPPYAAAVKAWEELERFLESRMRREG